MVTGVQTCALPISKRLPNDDCAAHTLPMFGWNAGVIQRALGNFTEDIRFGEFFRTDYNRIRG